MGETVRVTPLKQGGIYAIRHLASDRIYIGSAVNFFKRWKSHRDGFRKESHCNQHLQAAWKKYGEDAFAFEVVEMVDLAQDLIAREQHWIDHFQSSDQAKGYNLSPTAGSPLGVKHSEETRRRMSEAQRGKSKSPEHVEAVRKSITGLKKSPEHIEKIRQSRTGKKMTEEAKEKIRRHNLGKKMSPEAIAKTSAAWRGRKHTPQAIENIRKAQTKRRARERAERDAAN